MTWWATRPAAAWSRHAPSTATRSGQGRRVRAAGLDPSSPGTRTGRRLSSGAAAGRTEPQPDLAGPLRWPQPPRRSAKSRPCCAARPAGARLRPRRKPQLFDSMIALARDRRGARPAPLGGGDPVRDGRVGLDAGAGARRTCEGSTASCTARRTRSTRKGWQSRRHRSGRDMAGCVGQPCRLGTQPDDGITQADAQVGIRRRRGHTGRARRCPGRWARGGGYIHAALWAVKEAHGFSDGRPAARALRRGRHRRNRLHPDRARPAR